MFKVKKYKIARRLGSGVFEKTQTQKFILSEGKRAKMSKRPRRRSDFGNHLIEKQRVRVMYGVSERQFSNYVKKASETAKPAQTLFEILESRLDNIVYRMGLAPTRRMSRQMVSHGHFIVNNKRTKVPSQHMTEKDSLSIREGSKKTQLFLELDQKLKSYNMPSWVSFDSKKMSGEIKGKPTQPDSFLNFQAVIEFYSR